MFVVVFLGLEIISSLLKYLEYFFSLCILSIDQELLRVVFDIVSLLVDGFTAQTLNLLDCLREQIVNTLGTKGVVAIFTIAEVLARLTLWTLILKHFKLTF